MNQDEEIITLEEMCEILNIGKNTAYKLLNSRKVTAFRIGKTWKIPRSSISHYIQQSILSKKTDHI